MPLICPDVHEPGWLLQFASAFCSLVSVCWSRAISALSSSQVSAKAPDADEIKAIPAPARARARSFIAAFAIVVPRCFPPRKSNGSVTISSHLLHPTQARRLHHLARLTFERV